MANDRLKGMIGLAIKAGKAQSGSFAVEGAVRRRRAKLVIVDARASPNTLRQFQTMCKNANVPCLLLEDSGVLESLMDRDNRTVLAILDSGFAVAIQNILKKD